MVLDLGLDTTSPVGRFAAATLVKEAQMERRMAGARTSSALQAAKARGRRLSVGDRAGTERSVTPRRKLAVTVAVVAVAGTLAGLVLDVAPAGLVGGVLGGVGGAIGAGVLLRALSDELREHRRRADKREDGDDGPS